MDLIADRGRRVTVEELNTTKLLAHAAEQARDGRIAVLQFHGVPDTAHDWVSSSQQNFEAYMKYLKLEGYTVIALRDLKKYVDPASDPTDPNAIIEARKASLSK